MQVWKPSAGLAFLIAATAVGCANRESGSQPSPAAHPTHAQTTNRAPSAYEVPAFEPLRWLVTGHVTDAEGAPLPGVEITAHCGAGSLRQTGIALTDERGDYALEFRQGVMFVNDASGLQACTIAPHKPGMIERNLHRQGDLLMAKRTPDEDELRAWGVAPAKGEAPRNGAPNDRAAPVDASAAPDAGSTAATTGRVVYPHRPGRVDFVMIPAGEISGRLIDSSGAPFVDHYVSLDADELPPSSSALASMKTDAAGRFRFSEVPSGPVWLSIRDAQGVMNELCTDRLEIAPRQRATVELVYSPGPPASVTLRKAAP